MVRKVICPECEVQGLKSTACSRGSFVTLLSHEPFYDEEGNRHDHDPNTVTEGFECSNGHQWVEKYKRQCWCGWPHEKGVKE